MHQPNEPGTAGDHHNEDRMTPSDTLPPRRRRRAASRPAGPPVAAGGEEVVETASAPAPAAEAVEPAEETPAPRTRRRATRKATAPAGAPQADEAVEHAAEAVAEEEAPTEEAPTEEAPAPRTRRRATRKTAAPEPVAETVPGEGADEAAEAEEAPAPRTRRRATRKATAPAGAPQADEAAEVAAEAVAEEEASAPRKRRRATRKTAAPEPVAETAPAQDTEETAETGESLPVGSVTQTASPEDEVAAAEKAATRGRKRRGATPPEFTAQQTEPTGKPARAARPAVALFQAPVFAEPMFQTPETAAAAAAAAADIEDEEPVEDETAVAEAEAAPEPEPAGRRRRRRRGEPAEQPAAPAAEESEQAAEETPDEGEEHDESDDRPSRRRRRGGRRRRRGESGDTDEISEEQHPEDTAAAAPDESADEGEEQEEDEGAESEAPAAGSSSSRRRRRRRRRSGESGADDESDTGDPERTVVKVREPRAARTRSEETSDFQDAVQSIKGSTRLEAKKQRRREGREQGRRRVPIITEAEFLARREAVERVMVVRQSGERTQIGVLEDNVLVEHYVNKEQSTSYVGNVYLGKVQNVLPSMEAAFVDIGKGRNAVLYAGEVNFEALGMSGGPRRIEVALKSGQSVLVQVTKDPIGHKGARLTSQVSLPGRYLVYVPEGSMTGISRKLPDTERARLKTILKKIVPEDAGVIVRTAAEGASEDELRRDVERLQSQWEDIRKKAKNGNAPSLLYGEPDMTVRVVRDIFNEDFSKVIVSGDQAWETVHGYVAHVAPDLVDRLQRWTSEVDVFATYRIDEQLMKALDRKVWLPSGGSLVIDKTEAMVVIDVNTGKFTGQGGNLEETVTRNNLEAAEEIVRQLRLRDLGGIVVVDFIDMVLESNRDLVMRRLLECLGRDRTKHQVAEVTSLGLVQMTRKRVGQGLLESFSETCVHCNGRGVIVHMEQPASVGGGGGGKRAKKRGRGGAEQVPEHEHEAARETEAEVAAEVAEPAALAEPAFVPDEELYSSAAEAEAAAQRGRGRRRATRRVSAPSGSPRAAETKAAEAEIVTEPAPAAPVAEEPEPAEAVTAAEAAPEPATAGRTRRRATRKATAPAGSPKASEPEVVVETRAEAPAPEPEAPRAEAAPQEETAPAPPRARRRVTRKVTAPAGSPTGAEEAAVVVVDTPEPEAAPEGAAEAAEPEAAPAKKAARKTAKKATAKKAATKKTAAKKSAAKKTTAKKAAKKTTVAAEQQAPPSVTAVTEI
ncbi:ribonuclease E/G [Streptomyces sp. NPDC004609]|uniref:Rne/Rng family ribonuclease n=1 Tax=Streptomyces sp. NPDC004609 TaxID=3364704 RepID=UPI0036BC527A